VIGLLLGVIGGLGYYLWGGSQRASVVGAPPAAPSPAALAPKEPAKPAAKPLTGKESAAKEPTKETAPRQESTGEGTSTTTFDFYKLLPDLKVGEPQESAKPAAKEPPKPTAREPAKAKASAKEKTKESAVAAYMVQAGAFHTPQEADRLRARLAFLGLESSIQTVGVGTPEVWHRVRLGPFRDFNQAAHVQQRLRQEGISTTLSRESRS
jgi:cell division protein FtsN